MHRYMFYILPIGVEDHSVNRLPWVSIVFATICITLFGLTWLAPVKPLPATQDELDAILQHWIERPYLELPETFTNRWLSQGERDQLQRIATENEGVPLPNYAGREQHLLL